MLRQGQHAAGLRWVVWGCSCSAQPHCCAPPVWARDLSSPRGCLRALTAGALLPRQEAHTVREPDRLQDIRAQQAAAELDRGEEWGDGRAWAPLESRKGRVARETGRSSHVCVLGRLPAFTGYDGSKRNPLHSMVLPCFVGAQAPCPLFACGTGLASPFSECPARSADLRGLSMAAMPGRLRAVSPSPHHLASVCHPQECDNLWWDAFTTEFFEDDAMLTITFCLEDGPKRYTIGRTLIPRYFRSIFEGGATELYYVLKHPKESFHNNFVSLDCDQCTMVTQHGKPMFTQVCVEGRLYLEFMFDDMMRIKTWHFSIRQHRELIPRSILAMHAQDPQMLDQLSKNITRCGLSNSTLNYLRLCVILEPMQELMSRHKTYSLSPRDCLKTCLFQKWQRMVAPPAEPARQQPSKRRKRKMSGGSTMSSGGGNTNNSNSKKKSPASTFALSSQVPDVMVVGEPTLMGGEFGDEDERLITRLENTQFDAANGIDDEDSFNNSPALGANSPWNSKPPSSQESKSENPTSQASQ
uniref:LIM domain binding 1 n=4 Tax=Aves TaxID=8782 RepID=A0A8C4KF35_DRONO